MTPRFRFLSPGFVLLALGVIGFGCGQSGEEVDTAMDGIERELETGRHGQLLSRISATDVAMSSFTTDGCSGGLSSAWEELSDRYSDFAERHGDSPPWEECCVAHDRLYHAGGAKATSAVESFEQRREADEALRVCVANTTVERSGALQREYGLSEQQVEVLYQAVADAMYRAVRLGGIPCTDESWRWGYGWPRCE